MLDAPMSALWENILLFSALCSVQTSYICTKLYKTRARSSEYCIPQCPELDLTLHFHCDVSFLSHYLIVLTQVMTQHQIAIKSTKIIHNVTYILECMILHFLTFTVASCIATVVTYWCVFLYIFEGRLLCSAKLHLIKITVK